MEKRDNLLVLIVGGIVGFCGYKFDLDYSKIAESGLALCSIVLAVYIAAIVGLINSDLAKKMQKTVSASQKDRTQLGVLTQYFKFASACSIGTIIVSSLILLLEVDVDSSQLVLCAQSVLSVLGLVLYVENLVFLTMILRFMLNRQIWND